MKARLLKQILSLTMALTMAFTLLPAPAMAAVGDLLGRPSEENRAILEQLTALTGGSDAQALATLEALGLLDENGELNVSEMVRLDGVELTLAQVLELLTRPDADLSAVAEVDGVPITLGDLKTIVLIEQELQRIRETYFSGRTFTGESLDNLNSLLGQLESEGISLLSATPQGVRDGALDLSGVQGASWSMADFSDHGSQAATVVDHCEIVVPAGETVKFRYREIEGSLGQGMMDFRVEVTYADNPNEYRHNSKDPGSSNQVILMGMKNGADEVDVTYHVTVSVSAGKFEDPAVFRDGTQGMSGTLRGCVEFYDLENMSIYDGASYRDSYQIPVTVTKDQPLTFPNGTQADWMLTADATSPNRPYIQGMSGGPSGSIDPYTTPHWYLWNGHANANETTLYNETALEYTAAELFDGESATYKIAAKLGLWNERGSGQMMRALPRPTNLSGTVNFDILQYTWNNEDVKLENGQIHNFIRGPGMDKYAGNPYILIHSNQEDAANGTLQDVEIVASSSDGKVPMQLLTNWPVAPAFFVERAEDPYTGESNLQFGGDCGQYLHSCTISLFDDGHAPTVDITVPEGTYSTGALVPITLTFSEPVKLTGATMTINGQTYSGAQLQMNTGGRTAVAWYEVQDIDDTQLVISSITGVTDLFGNSMTEEQPFTAPGVTLKSALMRNAVSGVSAVYADGTANVTLEVKQNEAYRQKYFSTQNDGAYDSFKVLLTDAQGKTVQTVPCTLTEPQTNIIPVAEFTGIQPTTQPQTFTVSVRAYESADDQTGALCGLTGSFVVPAVVPVESIAIQADNPTRDLSMADTYRPTLTVNFTPSNTSFKTGGWTSSDSAVATVNEQNQVVLGSKIGPVTLTYTADNGTPGDTSDDKTASITYTVEAGGSPALVIPETASTILVRQNDPATVLWSSNASAFTDAAFTYTVEVFEGNYQTAEALAGKVPVFSSADVPNTATSLIIPENTLTALSDGTTPAYTVRVSMPHPKASNDTLSALAWIVVNPQPAGASLTRPASIYLTDDKTVEIGWTVKNFVPGQTDATLTITHVLGDNDSQQTTETITSGTGTYTLTPSPVAAGSLKETYMVTLSVQNQGDAAPDVDAFPLYVYRAGALQLEQDGQKLDSLTMDNKATVEGYTPASQSGSNGSVSEELLALREQLGLMEYVSINYGDYAWSQLADRIEWATSNPDVAINYKQGGLYENIELFGLDSYLPETKMALSSVKDGRATITATHANTGMSDSITVDVHTLRDKFFLFQLTPMVKTTLTYTDGNGVKKSVVTNDDGMLALYEPDGVGSDVALKSKVTDDVYLGTIYRENLLSGERDATKLQLYPLNTFKLRQVAKVDLSLTKPDGTPFSGNVILRGGVYKNDGYCQDAQVGTSADNMADGKSPTTFTVGADGKLSVFLDSTQFWSEALGEESSDASGLSATDRLQYIFEITGIESDKYYPLLVYANGNLTTDDVMRSAGSVVTLEEVPAGQANQPFLSNQFMDYGLSGSRLIDVRHSTGHIGPNSAYPEATLKSTVLLWGESNVGASDYQVSITDGSGYVPQQQTSRILTYPFSSIPVVSSDLTLSEATITDSGWVPDGKDVDLRVRLSQGNTLLRDLALPFRMMDMTRVEKVTESQNVSNMLLNLSSQSALGDGNGGTSGDAILSVLGGLLGGLTGPVNGTNFKMIISPSEDNTVFNAFIWAGYDSVGLDEVDYSETGMALDYGLLDGGFSVAPSLNDIADMARGSGGSDPNTQNPDPPPPPAGGGRSWDQSVEFGGQLEGYYEAEIAYNFEKGKWEIYTLGGGFTAGFSGGVNFGISTYAGPVPVFAEFGVGGAIQLGFKSAVRYSEQNGMEWADTVTSDTVNDFLTTLRLNAYVNAFGGIGMDYAIISLKIGLFGGLDVDNSNLFLSRPYLKDESQRQRNGQRVGISGQVGIKIEAALLILSYECVLASVSGGYTADFGASDLNDYWTNTGHGAVSQAITQYAVQNGLRVAGSSAKLQSRDYLADGERFWGPGPSLFALDDENGLKNLQSNANPQSYPMVTDDGYHLAYVSDGSSTSIYDSLVYAGELSGNYTQGSAIDDSGYGDSSLSLAGNEAFAAAAWVRQSSPINDKNAGDDITLAEQNLMLNSSEIVAAVYANGGWTAETLTDNATPDLAPVVATNGTNRAIVAWRSVYTGDPGAEEDGQNQLLNFSAKDTILYRIYSGSSWSEAKELYNGSAGAVKALQAAMLPDGTAAVIYTLDTNPADGRSTDYEIAYTMVDNSGALGLTMLPTSDNVLDENPQIAAVKFAENDYRFVMGWHSVPDQRGDIRLAAVDSTGSLSNSFPASIAQVVEQNPVTIGGEFRFAKMDSTHNSLNNLTILWPEQVNTAEGKTDHSILKAVKFRETPDGVSLSAPLDVAELAERTLLDHFDAYVSGENEVKAVLQATWYDPASTQEVDRVTVAQETTQLLTATGSFANRATVTNITPDYGSLNLNSLCAVQFILFNAGMDDIVSAEITLDDGAEKTYEFNGLSLAPNQSKTLTVWHPIGNTIKNPTYTVKAGFAVGGEVTADSGTLHLNYPDVGISQMETIEESEGSRTIRMTLYNHSAAKLAGSGRTVQLQFCTDGLFETLTDVTCSGWDGTTQTVTISGDNLALIDQGAFTLEVTFDVKTYVEALNLTEIPDSGIRLFARAGILEGGKVLPEYQTSNNEASVRFDSLLNRTGQILTLSTEQQTTATTTATVRLRNNSLQTQENGGSVIASLLDAQGNVLEQKQTTITGGSMGGETTQTSTVSFSKPGSRVAVAYGILQQDATGLAGLTIQGLPVQLSDFTGEGKNFACTLTTSRTGPALVTVVPGGEHQTITIDGVTLDPDVFSREIHLAAGGSTHTITCGDSTYTLTLRSPVPPAPPRPTPPTPTPGTHSGGSGGSSASPAYPVTAATSTPGGSVTVMPQRAEQGDAVTVTVTPKVSFLLHSLRVTDQAGRAIPVIRKSDTQFTFTMPEGKVKVEAAFRMKGTNPFTDIRETDHFYDAVIWAVDNGITNGLTDTTFAPHKTCTRAQTVTFLWRALGCPEPETAVNPFTDVPETAYYYKPVLWAMEQGVTKGLTPDTFAPDATVKRNQTVTFLWRAAGTPAAEGSNPFADVPADAYYHDAVLWAGAQGITNGTSADTFSPIANCTRGQIVKFLFSYMT